MFTLYLSVGSRTCDRPEFINLAHCVYMCDYHIVLVMRYREKCLTREFLHILRKSWREFTEHYPLIRIKTVNHDKDRIHILVSISNDSCRKRDRNNKTKDVS